MKPERNSHVRPAENPCPRFQADGRSHKWQRTTPLKDEDRPGAPTTGLRRWGWRNKASPTKPTPRKSWFIRPVLVARSRKRIGHKVVARRYSNELLSVDGVCYWSGSNHSSRVDPPQLCPGVGIRRKKKLPQAAEHQSPFGAHNSSCAPSWVLILPLQFSRYCVPMRAQPLLAGGSQKFERPSKEQLTWMITRNRRGEVSTSLSDGNIHETRDGAVRWGHPVSGACDRRIDRGSFWFGFRRRIHDRTSMAIDSIGPCLLCEWQSIEEVTRVAVEKVIKRIAICLCNESLGLTLNGLVE